MMKTAFATWDDRIAPVFDIARRIHVVEAASGRIVAETGEVLADDLPARASARNAGIANRMNAERPAFGGNARDAVLR